MNFDKQYLSIIAIRVTSELRELPTKQLWKTEFIKRFRVQCCGCSVYGCNVVMLIFCPVVFQKHCSLRVSLLDFGD